VVGSLIAGDKRDVDRDAECEGRILFHRPLGAECNRVTQQLFIDDTCAAVEVEERLIDGNEIADLGRKFDNAGGALRGGDQRFQIDRKEDSGATAMMDDPIG